ncbi:MAG: hypothetical protein J5636_11730 [Clostridiales bacterium]|nr:hypothetical protein [Clostridiales bacterium]
MSEEPEKMNNASEKTEATAVPRETEEKKPLVSGVDPAKAPVPTNLGVAVITILYILFVIAVCVGVIALSVFLFGKLWAWISG